MRPLISTIVHIKLNPVCEVCHEIFKSWYFQCTLYCIWLLQLMFYNIIFNLKIACMHVLPAYKSLYYFHAISIFYCNYYSQVFLFLIWFIPPRFVLYFFLVIKIFAFTRMKFRKAILDLPFLLIWAFNSINFPLTTISLYAHLV